MPPTSIFKGMESAQARFDANYIKPCHILARIDNCKIGENRKGEGFFVVEMTVMFDCAPEKFQQGIYGHQIGESVSHMIMQKHDSFLPNVKAFIANTLDLDDDEVGQEEADQVCGDDQPLRNTIIELVARNTTTRAGNDFTVVSYKGEVNPAKLKEAWEALEKSSEGKVSAEAMSSRYFSDPTLDQLIEAYEEQQQG